MKKWGEEEEEEDKGGAKEDPPPKTHQTLGQKLQRIAGKRGGQITPVLPFPVHVSIGGAQVSSGGAQDSSGGAQDSSGGAQDNTGLCLTLSARKLGAAVWELHQYNLPLAKMHHGGGSSRNHRHLQLNRHHHHHHHHHRQHLLDEDPDAYPEPGSASSLRRHVAASLMQHQQAIQRNHNAVRAVSPASYGGSSMEIAPYNPAVTPTSSIEFRGNRETTYSLKTSTELLKVLNRIWSLEELHAANITLIKDLKRELQLARSKIKELAHDRHEMERLMKQMTEDKQGHASAAVQSVRDELEDERKLRKRSETLHRKLARELYETKTSLMNALKDLDKERRSRVLLEDLCDEFAWGIKNYEHELHSLKHMNPDIGNSSNYRSTRDGMILHISESWLDERMQAKQEATSTKISVVEKLNSELQAFLETKRKGMQKPEPGSGSVAGPTARRRHSLESIPMNLAASAPPDDGDDDDDDNVSSAGGGSPCFELDKPVAHGKDDTVTSKTKPDNGKKKVARDPSSLQVKFEEQMAQAILGQEQVKTKAKTREENQQEITEESVGLNSKYLDSLLKNHHLQTGNEFDESANKQVWKSHPSPVRKWSTKLPTEDLKISESSSKVQAESKEKTTLKSKLLEARSRGHRLGSRVKK